MEPSVTRKTVPEDLSMFTIPFERVFGLVPKRLFSSGSRVFAGHSKWANIRHDKAKNDAKKSREAYSLATRITTSVKNGGSDGNSQLALLVEKAKKLNVAKKVIENAIKRGTGEIKNEGQQTSDVMYEFMGPGGVALIVEASTDNKNRTVGLVKHAMSKFNAALSPCQYLFERKGEIIYETQKEETLDDAFELAIDLGAEDVEEYDDSAGEYNADKLFRMITAPSDINKVSNKLSEKGYKLHDSQTSYIAGPDNVVQFPEEQLKAFQKAIELLDEIPEVTNYHTNISE